MRKETDPFVQGIVDDLSALAWLHDAEMTVSTLQMLRTLDFPSSLALLPSKASAKTAWIRMVNVVDHLPGQPQSRLIDRFAADYAEIYLTGALGVSPYESFWTDDDHLICQDAMFELRHLLAERGLVTTDWRKRSDDHLVIQLLLIGEQAKVATCREGWAKLADILDRHLLRWLPTFAARIDERSTNDFYRSLALLTHAWIDTLRDVVAELAGIPRSAPPPLPGDVSSNNQVRADPVYFVPGAGPSW